MENWLYFLLFVGGGLFALKMVYVLAWAAALPQTGGALFVPSSKARLNAFLDAVPMDEKTLLLDLGCGEGRVLAAAHRRYGMRAIGFEINFLAWFICKIRFCFFSDMRVVRKNFLEQDWREADVIFCYLFPDVMPRVANKLESDLKSGAIFVSANFPLPGKTPEQVLEPKGPKHADRVYVYTNPVRKT